jgi:lambda family phage portal protein
MALRDWFKKPGKTRAKQAPRMNYRQYAGARPNRLSLWQASNTSADSELTSSLTGLRTRSRQLVRDASYAKRARKLIIDNVIGTGIGLQALVESTRGVMRMQANDDIERAWCEWGYSDSCHTGGRLCFADLERLAMGEVFEAGEVFIRKHYRTFGKSAIPFALEVIEGERLADELMSPYIAALGGNELRMGIEVDQYGRPVAYHIKKRMPSEIAYSATSADYVERVPADQIIHLAIIDRWPQTRGVPWLDAAARSLANMDGYVDAEITRARVQALTVGAIETPQDASSFGEEQTDGSVEMEMQAGVFQRLSPGEKFAAGPNGSPNPALDGFMRYMLRDVASSIPGISYESLSMDYSQSNYSSSKLALIDIRDAWRHLQTWFIRNFREPIHREWMQQAVLSRAVAISADQYYADPEKWNAARFKPRGWTWVDPTKEVQAYKDAVNAGFTTVSSVIAATGGGVDLQDVLDERAHELKLMEDADLEFETSPDFYMAKATAAQAPAPAAMPAAPVADPEDTAPTGRLFSLR